MINKRSSTRLIEYPDFVGDFYAPWSPKFLRRSVERLPTRLIDLSRPSRHLKRGALWRRMGASDRFEIPNMLPACPTASKAGGGLTGPVPL